MPDVNRLVPLVLSVPLGTGTPTPWPPELLADRGYDSDPHRAALRQLGIEPRIGRRGTPHGSGLGKQRHVVEQTIATIHHNRRLKVRYEKRSDIHQAFLTLACIKACWYRLATK